MRVAMGGKGAEQNAHADHAAVEVVVRFMHKFQKAAIGFRLFALFKDIVIQTHCLRRLTGAAHGHGIVIDHALTHSRKKLVSERFGKHALHLHPAHVKEKFRFAADVNAGNGIGNLGRADMVGAAGTHGMTPVAKSYANAAVWAAPLRNIIEVAHDGG